MKKALTILLIIAITSAKAQVFTEIGLTNNGAHMAAGMLINSTGVSIGYHVPLTQATKPNIYYMAGMYEVNISKKEKDNFTATATAGMALHNYTDAGKYMGYINKTAAIYGLELGKDWFMGRLYIGGNYSNRLYIGGGMKIMFRN